LLSDGTFTMNGLFYTGIVSVIILFFGIIIFNKTEKNFIDTV
jgi:lipopolysaccharide transport system permease protein